MATPPAIGALNTSHPPSSNIETSFFKFKVIEDIPLEQQLLQPQIIEQPHIIK